jgi:hypothetical protein
VVDARGVGGFLQVEAEVDQVDRICTWPWGWSRAHQGELGLAPLVTKPG